MKTFLAMLGVGFLALILQGAIARTISPPWCPDLAWLVVIALGLRWRSFLSGVCLAVILGYSMDLVSGSLMGQHALMRLLAYLAAALAARQLDLSGVVSISILVFGMTLVYGVAVVGLLTFFVNSVSIGLPVLVDAFCHAVANVVAVGPVLSLVERILLRLSDEDIGRRTSMTIGLQRGSV